MAFEVRYAPKTNFDIAGAYFEALDQARAQQAAAAAQALKLQVAQQASDDRRYAVDSANMRAADRIGFERERDSFERSAQEAARLAEQDEAQQIAGGLYSMMGDGTPPSSSVMETPYGVKIPIVQPRSRAGAKLLLDSMSGFLDRRAKEQDKAAKEAEATRQRQSAANVAKSLGVPDGVEFNTPTEAMSFARVDATLKRLAQLNEVAKSGTSIPPEVMAKARDSFKTIAPYLSDKQVESLAWLRENKYPVPLPAGAQEPWRDPSYIRKAKDRERLADQIAAEEGRKFDTSAERKRSEERLKSLRESLRKVDDELVQIERGWYAPARGDAERKDPFTSGFLQRHLEENGFLQQPYEQDGLVNQVLERDDLVKQELERSALLRQLEEED